MKMINRPHPEANREVVEALRAALAAPVAAPVAMWQPIKTAPKDGMHILALLPDSDTCYVICWSDPSRGIRKELGGEVGWRIAYCGDLVGGASAPTHWMPLPDSSASAARPADDELWDKTLKERDNYQEWDDKLAAAIAEHTGVDIGEHSSANNPWHEAIEALGAAIGSPTNGGAVGFARELRAERDALRAEVERLRSGEPVATKRVSLLRDLGNAGKIVSHDVVWTPAGYNLPDGAPLYAAPPRREPLTPEQIAEAVDMLPKVGEREDCYCSIKGSTLRALMGAAGITPDKGSEPPKEST